MSKIDYQTLLDNALKTVVKDALIHAQFNGLGEGTHFFITFKTRDPGVVLPDFLRIRYPDIMTIVLQYSYNNLNVSDKEFGVQLTFDGRPFFIRVPFSALVEFKDPSVDFMLSLRTRGVWYRWMIFVRTGTSNGNKANGRKYSMRLYTR